MIVEHNICTMVQLTAEQTDNFQYWCSTDLPASESNFGAMKVTLVSKANLLPTLFVTIFVDLNVEMQIVVVVILI